ncbi:MAG: Ger(x)C family spore germination protein, partial [Clostridia bacterium]|nr:Ger(x)C family spore germination protein [Clostridia bacterium]
MGKKIAALLLIPICLMSGCSNYVEIEELIIVSGAAIDFEEETGKYNVTAEIIDLRASSGRE